MAPYDHEDDGHSQARRHELAEYLRSVRARVAPESAGLPSGGRRRTPGLRREEVAQMAGISVTWYTWMEQGRDITVSPHVLARLASVLQLTRAERHYLFDLAESADPEPPRDDEALLPNGLDACVQSIEAPAYILDRCWNVLARNPAMLDLFGGWPDRDPQPNLLRYIFMDAAARQLVADWETRAQRVIAEFRADVAAYADDAPVQALVNELSASSPMFAQGWTRRAVVEREGGLRVFNHPEHGSLRLQQFTFRLAIRPDCKLVMLPKES